MRRLLRVTAFPVLFTASVVLGTLGMREGRLALLVATVVGLGLVVAALERVIPYLPAWNRSQGDLATDLSYAGANALVHPVLSAATFAAFAPLGAAWRGVAPMVAWPGGWPLAAQIVLAVLIREFAHYWLHRYTHRRGDLLWRFHAIHHSSRRVYWLNASRMHAGNLAADAIAGIAPLVFLGAGPEVMYMTGLVIGGMNMFTHANLDLRVGPLAWIFNLPEVHRWHHARDTVTANHNYGDVLIIYDVLFGTLHRPREPFPEAGAGLDRSAAMPDDFARQLLWPWRTAKF